MFLFWNKVRIGKIILGLLAVPGIAGRSLRLLRKYVCCIRRTEIGTQNKSFVVRGIFLERYPLTSLWEYGQPPWENSWSCRYVYLPWFSMPIYLRSARDSRKIQQRRRPFHGNTPHEYQQIHLTRCVISV